MAGHHRTAARGVLALLLVSFLTGCAAAGTAADAEPAAAPEIVDAVSTAQGPTVIDSSGAPLETEHSEVVQAVHRALADGDLERLRSLYHGDDWPGQAALLSQQRVRDEVLTVLRTHPANLGEGYIYPGFSATGYTGYQTAFFLDYNPPHDTGGPLQWRGIATLPGISG